MRCWSPFLPAAAFCLRDIEGGSCRVHRCVVAAVTTAWVLVVLAFAAVAVELPDFFAQVAGRDVSWGYPFTAPGLVVLRKTLHMLIRD
jgi:hypothetical protein